MTTMIRVSRHGRLTLPPALCRKLGLAKLRAPMVSVEECEGGLLLWTALPIRDIPKKKIKEWVARDEADMAAVRVTAPRTEAKMPVPASHRAELNRRLAALAKNPEQGRPWSEVRGELQAGASLGKRPSPAWRRGSLREAERAVKAGKAKFVDWELAKKRLGRVSAKSRPRSRRS